MRATSWQFNPIKFNSKLFPTEDAPVRSSNNFPHSRSRLVCASLITSLLFITHIRMCARILFWVYRDHVYGIIAVVLSRIRRFCFVALTRIVQQHKDHQVRQHDLNPTHCKVSATVFTGQPIKRISSPRQILPHPLPPQRCFQLSCHYCLIGKGAYGFPKNNRTIQAK